MAVLRYGEAIMISFTYNRWGNRFKQLPYDENKTINSYMQIKNIELITDIGVRQVVGNDAWNKYQDIRSKRQMSYDWASLAGVPDQLVQDFRKTTHVGFWLIVIGYPMPEFAKRGMTRRESQTMLREFGLEPLSTIQTIQVATQTIVTGQMLEVCKQNDHRRIVATPPIHPEAPGYFYFGAGNDGKGSFRHFDYQRNHAKNEKDNLYFWHHNGNDDEVSPNERYHFPLLLGVRKQS